MSRRRPDDEDDDPREQIQSGQPRRASQPPARDNDDDEDRPRRRPGRRDDDDYDAPAAPRNGMALTGYYMGFLALISVLGGFAFIVFYIRQNPFNPSPALLAIVGFGVIYGMGGISSLLAIIFGGIGLARAKQGKGTAHAIVGLILGVLVIIGLIVLTLMGALAARR